MALTRICGDWEGSYNELPHWMNMVWKTIIDSFWTEFFGLSNHALKGLFIANQFYKWMTRF
ncbi:hypothetical protein Lal_00022187 [Lupinus albus]|nr:hypothetical protein Lal_00022187 [Lupinus albus]